MAHMEIRTFQNYVYPENGVVSEATPRHGNKYQVQRVKYGSLKVGDHILGQDPLLCISEVLNIELIPRKKAHQKYTIKSIPVHHISSSGRIFEYKSQESIGVYHKEDNFCWKLLKIID